MEEDSNGTILSNDTDTEDFFSRTKDPDWIIPFTINILLIVITIIILISLVYYGIKTGKWRQSHTCNYDKLNAGIVYTFLVACGVSCLFRYTANQVYMNVGFRRDEDELCEAAADTAFVSYAMVLFSVSMFLWFRQKAFYTNRMLSFKSSNPVRIISFGSIILILGGGFSYLLLYTIPTNYASSSRGCYFVIQKSLIVTYNVFIVILIVVAQILLLCLFVYPLMKLYFGKSEFLCIRRIFVRQKSASSLPMKMPPNTTPSNSIPLNTLTIPDDASTNIERSRSLAVKPSTEGIKRILLKTLIFAVCSTLVDVIIQIVSFYLNNPNGSRRITNMLFDIAAFLNLLFLILSFVTCRNMLFSLCYKDLVSDHCSKDLP